MKIQLFSLLTLILGMSVTIAPSASAKDKPIQLTECPAAVQKAIQESSAKGTLEEIGVDEKKKTGGPAIYEAKFTLADGNRVEVHFSADGQIVTEEKKKPKKK